MTWILVLVCSGYNQIENALIDWFGFKVWHNVWKTL